MDGKVGTFLLGVIAAIVLYMLWDRNRDSIGMPSFLPMAPQDQPGSQTNCGGCSVTSPNVQAQLESTGTAGLVASPGVPLNAATGGQGATSFYTAAGVTPDTSFTFNTVPRNTDPNAIGTPAQPGGLQGNVPGSPTTPSTVTPVRATQPVPGYSVGGFHQRYNILGVPLPVLQQRGYLV